MPPNTFARFIFSASLCVSALAAPGVGIPSASSLFGRQTGHGYEQPEGNCVSEQSQPDWYHRNLKTVEKIYDMTVYPKNVPIITEGAKAVPHGLFNENATGRVSPVGEFEGFQDSIEYFFALAPTPQMNKAGTAFYKAEVVDFVSGCPNVAASLVYFRTGKVSETGERDKTYPTSTLSQIAFWHFDDTGAVDKYQAWIPNLQAWTKSSTGIDYNNMAIQKGAAVGLCPVIQQRCTGKDQQYSSTEACGVALEHKPFGNFDEAWGDNIACRTIHVILTMLRPDIHCPHVGPTGGNKCIDINYSKNYFDDEKLLGGPLGSVFTCSGQLVDVVPPPTPQEQAALRAALEKAAAAQGQKGAGSPPMSGAGQQPAAGSASANAAGSQHEQAGYTAKPPAGSAADTAEGYQKYQRDLRKRGMQGEDAAYQPPSYGTVQGTVPEEESDDSPPPKKGKSGYKAPSDDEDCDECKGSPSDDCEDKDCASSDDDCEDEGCQSPPGPGDETEESSDDEDCEDEDDCKGEDCGSSDDDDCEDEGCQSTPESETEESSDEDDCEDEGCQSTPESDTEESSDEDDCEDDGCKSSPTGKKPKPKKPSYEEPSTDDECDECDSPTGKKPKPKKPSYKEPSTDDECDECDSPKGKKPKPKKPSHKEPSTDDECDECDSPTGKKPKPKKPSYKEPSTDDECDECDSEGETSDEESPGSEDSNGRLPQAKTIPVSSDSEQPASYGKPKKTTPKKPTPKTPSSPGQDDSYSLADTPPVDPAEQPAASYSKGDGTYRKWRA